MRVSAHIRTLLLIGLFAAGMVVQTANATFMSVAMAITESGAADMSDCNGCDADNDGSTSCGFPCVPQTAGTLDAGITFQPAAEARADSRRSNDFRERAGPPEPDPPQVTILS
jgi:hypothetical protein